MTTIYTFGYLGRSVEDLRSEADRLCAVVVDVRFSPFSRNPTWTSETLRERLPRYQWLRAWGNQNYKGGPILIHDFKFGAGIVKAFRSPAILLCACADVEECHRKVVADRFAIEQGWAVEHLAPAPRAVASRPVKLKTRSLFDDL